MTGEKSWLKTSVWAIAIIGLAVISLSFTSGVSGALGLTSGHLGFVGGLLALLAPLIQFLTQLVFGPNESRALGEGSAIRDRNELIGELDRLNGTIRDWEGNDSFYWSELSAPQRSEFDSEVRSLCDELVEMLEELSTVNRQLRISLSRDLQADPAIVERSLPTDVVDTDSGETRVITAWKGCSAKNWISDYEWIAECGSIFIGCESEAELRTRMERKSSRPDVHFEIDDWNGMRDMWERDWEAALWDAKQTTDRTVWEVANDNRELFEQQERLLAEIFALRSDIYTQLDAVDRDTWSEDFHDDVIQRRQSILEAAVVLPSLS